jgi:2-hydroxychromene-2-carboxylate isomerase
MTDFDPLRSERRLIVYIDFKSPYAYIAKDPTYAIEDQFGIEIDWRPLTLDIPSYLGSARLDPHGKVIENNRTPQQWSGVKYAYRDARRYATLRGLTLRGTEKIWDSSLAGIGMQWAKQQGRSVLRGYIDRVFERFWKRELDIEDPRVIEAVLAEAGAALDGFAAYRSGDGRVSHAAIQQQIFAAGVFGVPSYVIDGQLFFGREHLPMVRWLLRGKRGAAPDIAYRHFVVTDSVSNSALADPLVDPLTVCIDFKNPKCYLALQPTYALEAELGVEFDWLPLLVSPLSRPRESQSDEDRGTRHRRIRAQYYEHDIRRYARSYGLELADLYRAPDASIASIGLLWVKERSPAARRAYVDLVFKRYWSEQLNIEAADEIGALLREIGVDMAGWSAYVGGAGREALDATCTRLRDAGLFDVPGYIVENEIFFGRQHLPMIRWILSGRRDEPPI